VEKYDGARQATGYNIVRRTRIACWITKAINTHSECLNSYFYSTARMVYTNATHYHASTYMTCLVLSLYSLLSFHNSWPILNKFKLQYNVSFQANSFGTYGGQSDTGTLSE
jgi:hypothetical protein